MIINVKTIRALAATLLLIAGLSKASAQVANKGASISTAPVLRDFSLPTADNDMADASLKDFSLPTADNLSGAIVRDFSLPTADN